MRAVIVGVAIALLVSLPGQAAANERQFTYLATRDLYAGGSLLQPHTPAGDLALAGNFSAVPTGKSITMILDDFATPDKGAVHVEVSAGGRNFLFRGCLPLRKKVTITGLVPGRLFIVYIGGIATGCSSPGTAGVATITGLK